MVRVIWFIAALGLFVRERDDFRAAQILELRVQAIVGERLALKQRPAVTMKTIRSLFGHKKNIPIEFMRIELDLPMKESVEL